MSLPLPLNEFLETLGVGHVLGAYETMPWSAYDPDQGLTCTAEVRMNADGNHIDAEVQVMRDEPKDGELPMEQIFTISCAPSPTDWTVKDLKIRNEPLEEDVYNWQEKSCDFFQKLTEHLMRDEIPDIDELLEECLHSKERFHDQWGSGGGKKPKINTAALMNNKKGGF